MSLGHQTQSNQLMNDVPDLFLIKMTKGEGEIVIWQISQLNKITQLTTYNKQTAHLCGEK